MKKVCIYDRIIDHWHGATVSEDMPIIEAENKLICLYGWNGESWTESFEVLDKYEEAQPRNIYDARPVYRWEEEGIDIDALEEGSDEEAEALEIVDINLK